MASSDEARHKCSKTDLRKQPRLVQASLYMVMLAADGPLEGTPHLEYLAVLHNQAHLDIPPHLYDLWLDCLVRAVTECDHQWPPATEPVWRSMIAIGLAFMK